MNKPELDQQADELAALLDSLMADGTQHINLTAGEQLRVQTVNSIDCGRIGACAVPNLELDDLKGEE